VNEFLELHIIYSKLFNITDNGKPIERWGRKVTGLKILSELEKD